MKRKTIFSIVLICFCLFLVGCSCSEGEKINEQEFSLNDTNILDNYLEFKFIGATASNKVAPSAPLDNATFYEPKVEENVYVKADINVKNLGKEDKAIENIIKAKFVINNKEYEAFSVVEEEGGYNFKGGNEVSLGENQEETISFLAEIPKIDLKNEVKLVLHINGNMYTKKFTIVVE